MLCTLNLHNVVCQLYLSEAGGLAGGGQLLCANTDEIIDVNNSHPCLPTPIK